MEAAARLIQRTMRNSGHELDRRTRLAFEEAAIRIARLPHGFPRELLHRDMSHQAENRQFPPREACSQHTFGPQSRAAINNVRPIK